MRVWIVFFFLSVAVLSAAQQKYTDARLRVIDFKKIHQGYNVNILSDSFTYCVNKKWHKVTSENTGFYFAPFYLSSSMRYNRGSF